MLVLNGLIRLEPPTFLCLTWKAVCSVQMYFSPHTSDKYSWPTRLVLPPNIPLPLLAHNTQSPNILSLTASIGIEHQICRYKWVVIAEWKAIKPTKHDTISASTKQYILANGCVLRSWVLQLASFPSHSYLQFDRFAYCKQSKTGRNGLGTRLYYNDCINCCISNVRLCCTNVGRPVSRVRVETYYSQRAQRYSYGCGWWGRRCRGTRYQ